MRELHHLAVEGREESSEADDIREASDGPWYALSETERTRAAGLSGDLDTLVDPSNEAKPMNPQAQSKLNEFFEARERGEWDRALALLRRWAKYIAPPLLAYLRGTAWLLAGDRESAALFFERAHLLDADNPDYLIAFLRSADPARAEPTMRRILQEPEAYSPRAVVWAVSDALGSGSRPSIDEYRRLADILQEAVARVDHDPRSGESTFRLFGFRQLGLCREWLGENQAAVEAYTQGLAIDPDDAALLAARGIVGYGSGAGAIRDLERSVALRADFIAPHFFLAHHRFNEQRFDDCLRLCDDAMRFNGPPTMKSMLMEWSAIARAELGFPPAMVREAFEESVRLDPSNERARRNRELYEGRLASAREGGPEPFETPTPRQLRASAPPEGWARGAA